MNTNRAGLYPASGVRVAQRQTASLNRLPNTAAPASFEASLRSSTLPVLTQKKAWNSNKRASGTKVDGRLKAASKPPQKVTLSTIKGSSIGAKPPKVPTPTRSNVEVTAQCFPATGITIQTMHSLKDLVDNFVQSLLKGTGQFDASRLESLRQMFATITKDQVQNFKLSPPLRGQPAQGQPHASSNHSAPCETLYQSLLWCLIFQASIDMLSTETHDCSVNNLLDRAWDYLENLRGFFIPFVRSKEEEEQRLMVTLNQNQSNVRGIKETQHGRGRTHHRRRYHVSKSLASSTSSSTSSSTPSTEDESASSELPIRPPKSRPAKAVHHHHHQHHGHHNNHEKPGGSGGGDTRFCDPNVPRNHMPPHHSHQQAMHTSVPSLARSVKVGTENNAISYAHNSVSVQTARAEMVNAESSLTSSLAEAPLVEQYKLARKQLAIEADKYLTMYRQCQHLQGKLKVTSPRIPHTRVACCEVSESDMSFSCSARELVGSTTHVIVEKSRTCFRVVQQPLEEHYTFTPLEAATPIRQVEHRLPRITLEPLPFRVARLRPEAVCMLSVEIPLLSLLDLQWFVEQFKRSDSFKLEDDKKKFTMKNSGKNKKNDLYRVIPFKCRKYSTWVK